MPDTHSPRRSRPITRLPAKKPRRSKGRPALGKQTVGRDALIESACDLLREVPPNKITPAELARRLRVHPSLLRYYFKNRGELLLATVERLTTRFTALRAAEIEKSDLTPAGLLRARLTAILRFEIAYPFFHRLLIDEIVPLNTPAAERFMEELTSRAVRGYGDVVTAGVKQGVFRDVDHSLLFLTVMAVSEFFVNGLPILRYARGKKLDLHAEAEQYRTFICELLLNGLNVRNKR